MQHPIKKGFGDLPDCGAVTFLMRRFWKKRSVFLCKTHQECQPSRAQPLPNT